MARFRVAVPLAVVCALVAADAAAPCSCVPPDPRRMLAAGDAAFVGTLIERRVPAPLTSSADRAVNVFRVERSLKGDLSGTIEVDSAASGASCGLEGPIGERIGLVLRRDDGRWTAGLCSQIDPDELVAAAGPLPAPLGRGPLRLLAGGSAGPARLVALDARGRVLGYGMGSGETLGLSVCPGGKLAAEGVWENGRYRIEIRDLRSMRVLRTVRRLPKNFSGVHCADGAGRELYGNVDLRAVTVRGRTITRSTGSPPLLAGGRAYAIRDRALYEVALSTGERERRAAVPSGASIAGVDADSRTAALVVRRGDRWRPIVVPPAGAVAIGDWAGGLPGWRATFAGSRIAFTGGDRSDLRLVDLSARPLGRPIEIARSGVADAAAVGDRLFVLGSDARLRRLSLSRPGTANLAPRLPSRTLRTLVAVPDGPVLAPSGRARAARSRIKCLESDPD